LPPSNKEEIIIKVGKVRKMNQMRLMLVLSVLGRLRCLILPILVKLLTLGMLV
jgi:hypothetical protein